MEKLLNNLHIYEIVLLFLGVFLFMILCVALLYSLWKGQYIKRLLYFFIICIIMIGYPSIQEVRIEDNKISFTKYKEQIRENPNDSVAVKELEKILPTIESRATSAEDLLSLSEAYVLLEKSEKAIETADRGIQKDARSTVNPQVKKEHLSQFNDIKTAAILQKELVNTKPIDTTFSPEQLRQMKTLSPNTRRFFKQKYTLQPQKRKE